MARLNRREVYLFPADFKEREMRSIKAEGQWLLVICFGGAYWALDASCAHSGAPLHEGKLDPNGVVTCASHYAQFDCKTGAVVSKPAICQGQRRFELSVRAGKIYWVKPEEPSSEPV